MAKNGMPDISEPMMRAIVRAMTVRDGRFDYKTRIGTLNALARAGIAHRRGAFYRLASQGGRDLHMLLYNGRPCKIAPTYGNGIRSVYQAAIALLWARKGMDRAQTASFARAFLASDVVTSEPNIIEQ